MLQARTQTGLLLLISSQMSTGWSLQDAEAFWVERRPQGLLQNPVSARHQSQLLQRHEDRQQTLDNKRESFVTDHRLQNADGTFHNQHRRG